MVKSIYFALFMIAIIFSAFKIIENNTSIRSVYAREGEIDLSLTDFDKEVVSLEGDWRFYWKAFLAPKENHDSLAFFQVPGSWNISNRYSRKGFATYRIKLILPKNGKRTSFGFYLNRVESAYQIYANGHLLGGNGVVGKNAILEKPHRETKLYHLDVPGDTDIELLIHISNHSHKKAGLRSGILFSHKDVLARKTFGFFVVDFFTSCAFLILSVITFSVYVFRPDRRFLYITFFLLSIFIYIIGTGENIAAALVKGLEWMLLLKIIHLCLALHIQFFSYLLDAFFYEERINSISLFFKIISFLYAAIVVVTPISFSTRILSLFHLIILLALVYWTFILLKASIRKKAGALIILFGVVAYAISAVLELRYLYELSHNPRVIPLGLMVLVFSYIVVYAEAFAESYHIVEKAEQEKHQAIEQANTQKAELAAEKERSSILHKTLTDSESIGHIEKIRRHLLRISYLVSSGGGCTVYDDQGDYLFDLDLTLKKVTEIFGANNQLMRCSKAYVVNPTKALKVVRIGRRYELQFLNAKLKNIPVGNKYVSNVKNCIQVN